MSDISNNGDAVTRNSKNLRIILAQVPIEYALQHFSSQTSEINSVHSSVTSAAFNIQYFLFISHRGI